MVFRSGAKVLLALTVVGLAALLPQAGGLATPDLYPGAEDVVVKWMSGVTMGGRACVGSQGLHGHDAYDLIADNSADPYCYDGGVPAAVSLRTLGYSSTSHVTLRATLSSGSYPPPSNCDYIHAETVQYPMGVGRGTYRYVHAQGSSGWTDIYAGPGANGYITETPIGTTSKDDDCRTADGQPGWDGYHTHQDSGNPTSQWSQVNSLAEDDDIALWAQTSWIQKWTYPIPDTDGDDFQDAAEGYIGTDRLDRCPDNPSDDAWPLDINKDRVITVADVLNYNGRIGAGYGDPNYWPRLDLNTDFAITVADVMMYSGKIGATCYN